MNENHKNQLFNYSLIILFLIVGFVPNFKAIDKVGPQFLYLAVLNTITLINLISRGGLNEVFKRTFKNNFIVYLLFSFWAWGLASLTYAINKPEVLIESSRIFIYVHSFINLFILIKWAKINLNKVLIGFSIILGIEVLLVLSKFYDFYLSNYDSSKILGRNLELRAFTGNINITAFTMALKTPFLIYLLHNSKRINFILKAIILAITFFTIFILGSRGANITIGIIAVLTAILGIKNTLFNKKLSTLVLGGFALGISLNYIIFINDSDLNYLTRTSNVLETSSQKRIGYYKYAIQSVLNNPLLGIGLGNWKIFSITSETQAVDDYQIPYHVHNDYLEVAAEIGIIGMMLFYGIYIYLFFVYIKFFKRPKIPDSDKILGVTLVLGLLVYLCDSFLNFPFTRPVMQIPNLFFIGLSIYLIKKNKVFLFKKQKLIIKNNLKIIYLIFSLLGLSGSIYISYSLFISLQQQNFLIIKNRGLTSDFSAEDVYSIDSKIPNISVHTVPIDAMKASLLMRLDELDSVLKFSNNGIKANPFIGYPQLGMSVYFIQLEEIDSAYYYAKKAYDISPNYNHFDHYINMIEFKKDSLDLKKLYEDLKNNYSEKKYTKYLQVSSRIKNNLSLTDQDLIQKLFVNNPLNSVNKAFTIMGEIGRENVRRGVILSYEAEKYYNQNDFINAAELFLEASQYNPLEIAYLENAANSFMKINEDKKAITILEKLLIELNPKTGKTEYLLGIIYLDLDQEKLGCDYLRKAKSKGFSFPDEVLNQFCKTE
ncbi:MAG: O-antigen ligase family protein [Flavobacteriaceae bacterium]